MIKEFININKIFKRLKSKVSFASKQRDQYGYVLDDLGDGIVVIDEDGNITFKDIKTFDTFFKFEGSDPQKESKKLIKFIEKCENEI